MLHNHAYGKYEGFYVCLFCCTKEAEKQAKFSLPICRDDSLIDFVSILQASRHIQPSWIVIVETNLHFACYRLFRLTESIDKKIETCNFIG